MAADSLDILTFADRAQRARASDPARVALAARTLVEGALRIRRGGDGIYGDAPARPVTKPAEAIGAWVGELERDAARSRDAGRTFHRDAELREALAAAGEEVDKATRATPGSERLREALLGDAAAALDARARHPTMLPWIIAGVLAGTLLGVLLSQRRRR